MEYGILIEVIFVMQVQLQTQTETQTQGQAQNRFTETDNRDWRARTEKPPAPAVQEEKSWDNIRETKELYNSSGRKQEQFNRQDQPSSQYPSKAQVKEHQLLTLLLRLTFLVSVCSFNFEQAPVSNHLFCFPVAISWDSMPICID